MLESFLSRILPSARKKVHLRHIIQLGTVIERRAEIFYKEMAENCEDDEVKNLYLLLASEEQRHHTLLEGILSRWKKISHTPKDLKALQAKKKLDRIFEDRPESGERGVIEYALNAEKKMVAFYESYENEFVDLWKLSKLQKMIDEERGHVRMLSNMISKI